MKNSSFTSPLSLRSIEAGALKAAKVAEVTRSLASQPARKPSAPRRPRADKPQSPIDRDTRNIIDAIKRQTGGEKRVIVGSTPTGRCSASIFDPEELSRPLVDKSDERRPEVRYVFYPSAIDPHSLGSVAIYSADAEARQALLAASGHLFGYAIRRCTLELGRRPFVDVTLR